MGYDDKGNWIEGGGYKYAPDSPQALEDQHQRNIRNAESLANHTVGGYGGADQEMQQYDRTQGLQQRQLGRDAQLREGVGVNYGQANADRQNSLAARGQQQQVTNSMIARAMGQTPSIAQMQADRQMQQATAAQASAAASARGPAALAMAQQNAAANTASMQSNISQQAQIAAAQERLAAEQAAFGATSGMRGQDLGSQAQTAQQAQYQAGLTAQQRGLNDQYDLGSQQLGLGYNKLGFDVASKQADVNLGHRQVDLGQYNGETNRTHAQNEDTQGYLNIFSDVTAKENVLPLDSSVMGASPIMGGGGGGMGGGMIGSVAKYAMLSDERAKTKPTYSSIYRAITQPREVKDPQGAVDLGTVGEIRRRAAEEEPTQRIDLPSFSSPGRGGGGDSPPAKGLSRVTQSKREPSLEEQGRMMLAETNARNDVLRNSPTAVQSREPMANALQALKPYAYDYKPGMGPPGKNVGPMANTMAQDPVASTAVTRDPQSGLLAIDRDRALKLSLGANGYLGQKQEEQQAQISALARAIGRRA